MPVHFRRYKSGPRKGKLVAVMLSVKPEQTGDKQLVATCDSYSVKSDPKYIRTTTKDEIRRHTVTATESEYKPLLTDLQARFGQTNQLEPYPKLTDQFQQ